MSNISAEENITAEQKTTAEEKRPLLHRLNAGRYKVLDLSLLFCVLLCLCLPLFPRPDFALPGWPAWLGRFHPLIVHFPLAIVPLIGLLELFHRARPFSSWPTLKRILWQIALISAVGASAAGYFLLGSGDYGAELADEHFRGGVITTALIAITLFLSRRMPARPASAYARFYYVMLCITLLGILYTGHHGGSLTHGSSFLSEAMPLDLDDDFEDKPRAELLVYGDLVAPLLEQRCVSCHNNSKTKGGLQLTSIAAMQAGGDSDLPVLTPHEPQNSNLYARITLPAGDEDIMPPAEKSPLSSAETALITWWIEQGASETQQYGAGPADSSRNLAISRLVDTQLQLRRRRALQQQDVQELATSLAQTLPALRIMPDSLTRNTSLAVSMHFPPKPVNDDTIAELAAHTDQISSLSLVGSDISDDALYHIGRLSSLQNLYLTYTKINGSTLGYLADLPALNLINLSGTALTNAHALNLTSMPALETVYLYDTPVDSIVVAAIQEFMPTVELSREVGPLHQH